MKYKITPISVKENIAIADELLEALHLSELNKNPHTAAWESIRHGYLQYIISCQENCDGRFLIASNEDGAIGFIFGYIDEQDESNFEKETGDDLYVSEGFIKEAYRKQGIYSALNTAFEQHYKDYNIRRIYRYTLCNNLTMQHWLGKNGYNPVRLVYEKWLRPS